MATISTLVAKTIARRQSQSQANNGPDSDSVTPIVHAPTAPAFPTAPGAPPQDLPVAVPQRGSLPASLVNVSDLNDSQRQFRSGPVRSAVFPYPAPTSGTGSDKIAQIQASIVAAQTETATVKTQTAETAAKVAGLNMDTIAEGQNFGKPTQTALTPLGTVNPALPGVVMKGSLPPIFSSGFTYTATTTTITWNWAAITVYRADGTTTTIPAGTQTITGLTASTTYYFYPTYNEATNTFFFVGTAALTNNPSITGVTPDGVSGQITTTGAITYPTTYTVEMWIHTTATGQTFLELNSTSGSGAPSATFGPNMGVAGHVATLATKGSTAVSGTTAIDNGAWHHVVGLYNGTTAQIYVDGVQQVSASSTAPTSFTGFWRIGHGAELIGFFSGTIAHVAVYNTELSATQIQNHYTTMISSGPATYAPVVIADGAVHYWQLVETSGTSAADTATGGTDTGTYQATVTLNQSQGAISPVGSPAIAWINANSLAGQAQNLQGNVSLSSGAMIAATPASGSGGGSGGGSTGGTGGLCFSSDTLVQTRRGSIPACEIVVGDIVRTVRGTVRPVTKVHTHEYSGPMQILPDGLITPSHKIFVDGQWIEARLVLTAWEHYAGTVYNFTVETDDSDDGTNITEHSYTLACGIAAHNVPFHK
jgi:hypothetical protein